MTRFLILLAILFIPLTAQSEELEQIFCYKYGFRSGDTLLYNISAHDSIIIAGQPTLIKDRTEKLRIVCRNIEKSIMSLELTLLSSISIESSEGQTSTRTTSPWLGRKIYLDIDSTGARHGFDIDDNSSARIATGGAFQPTIIMNIDTNCGSTKKPWLSEEVIKLPENSSPPSILRHMTYFKALPQVDTLGHQCNNLSYARTGQGSFSINTRDLQLQMTSIINSVGNIYFSQEYQLPLWFYQTIEEKLTFYHPNEEKYEGKHYTNAWYTLEYINR